MDTASIVIFGLIILGCAGVFCMLSVIGGRQGGRDKVNDLRHRPDIPNKLP